MRESWDGSSVAHPKSEDLVERLAHPSQALGVKGDKDASPPKPTSGIG